jgi:hypothetical protein
MIERILEFAGTVRVGAGAGRPSAGLSQDHDHAEVRVIRW